MLAFLSSSIYSPLLVVGIILILAHLVARLCFFSHLTRANRLFSSGQWLPLRFHDSPCTGTFRNVFETVEFSTCDGLTLRGSYFHSTSPQKRGVILYFHEMNGNRWSISPYIDVICDSGFDLLTFDQRGHGESDLFEKFHQTPWVTIHDLDDVNAAVNYLYHRQNTESSSNEIGVFGLGKGATLALCCASGDSRVKAVVMDTPAYEGHIYKKNCLTAFMKNFPTLASRNFSLSIVLLGKTLAYLVAYPFIKFFTVWQRFMMSVWCKGTFVNAWSMIKKMNKPILILYNKTDVSCNSHAFVSLPQIHAFCRRMTFRPKICIFSGPERADIDGGAAIVENPDDESLKVFGHKITSFFEENLDPVKGAEKEQIIDYSYSEEGESKKSGSETVSDTVAWNRDNRLPTNAFVYQTISHRPVERNRKVLS